MRMLMIGAMAAGLVLAGCSQKTQDNATAAAQGAVSDTASNLDVASSAVSNAANDIGDDQENGANTNVTTSVSGNTTTTVTTTTSTD